MFARKMMPILLATRLFRQCKGFEAVLVGNRRSVNTISNIKKLCASFPQDGASKTDPEQNSPSTSDFDRGTMGEHQISPQQHPKDEYSMDVPIEKAFTPPSTWYTDASFFQFEKDAVWLKNWVAVDVWPEATVADEFLFNYKTGYFMGQPYLLTRNKRGQLQAFYNVCTHAGSCLAGPWTNDGRAIPGDACRKTNLNPSLVGQPSQGLLQDGVDFQCPYHGWRFNLDGKLTRATDIRGIENFRARDFSLPKILARQIGPIVFLNFQQEGTSVIDNEQILLQFDQNHKLLSDRLETNGFVPDLSDLKLVETRAYKVQCNWKVFADNYGDGCYHCSYAHADLVSNIDELNYSTQLLSPELSIQQAPPSNADERFGEKTAVYAQLYPNVMLNRYGPWLDIDVIVPVGPSSCTILKAWFLEKDFVLPNPTYVTQSLASSEKVHEEDVFLCENVFVGLMSKGFHRGRYVPTRQIAAHHFHKRLARDIEAAGQRQ